MDDLAFIKDYLNRYKSSLFETDVSDELIKMKEILLKIKENGKKVIIAGNGGSAAMASHVAVDFTKQGGIRTINFNDADLITCFANDYGYEYWVAKAIEFYGDEIDSNGNFVGPYSPGTFSHDPSKIIKDSDELIEKLTEEISQCIRGRSFGNLIIGEVSEILDNNIVKILLYDNQTVNRNVTLAHKLEYVWIDDGYEKRIEDIELGLEYSQNNPEKLDSTKYQKLLLELKGLKDGTDRNRGERAGMGTDYTLDIIDVIDNTIIAKIISKDPPYMKVRLEDRIRIKYE